MPGGPTARQNNIDTTDDDGVYAAGYDSAPGNGQWHIEKRNRENGERVWKKTSDYSDKLDKAHGLTVDETGLYIPGYQNAGQWRIERRSTEDGSVIWETLSSSGGRLWYAVDTDDTAVYVGGYVDGKWRIEKRAKGAAQQDGGE